MAQTRSSRTGSKSKSTSTNKESSKRRSYKAITETKKSLLDEATSPAEADNPKMTASPQTSPTSAPASSRVGTAIGIVNTKPRSSHKDGALPTPPNSISPNLPPQSYQMAMATTLRRDAVSPRHARNDKQGDSSPMEIVQLDGSQSQYQEAQADGFTRKSKKGNPMRNLAQRPMIPGGSQDPLTPPFPPADNAESDLDLDLGRVQNDEDFKENRRHSEEEKEKDHGASLRADARSSEKRDESAEQEDTEGEPAQQRNEAMNANRPTTRLTAQHLHNLNSADTAFGDITPTMLAKHHLPNILLNNGPLAIRHLIGYLTTSVPGFSGIPPTTARSIVVMALEGRGADGHPGSLNPDIRFERIGSGQYDARSVKKRQSSSAKTHMPPLGLQIPKSHYAPGREASSAGTTNASVARRPSYPHHSSSYQQHHQAQQAKHPSQRSSSSIASLSRHQPHHGSRQISRHRHDHHQRQNSIAHGSHASELSYRHHDGASMVEHEADQMSLSQVDEDQIYLSPFLGPSRPSASRRHHARVQGFYLDGVLVDDEDDEANATDEEDWATIGAAALRKGSLPAQAPVSASPGLNSAPENINIHHRGMTPASAVPQILSSSHLSSSSRKRQNSNPQQGPAPDPMNKSRGRDVTGISKSLGNGQFAKSAPSAAPMSHPGQLSKMFPPKVASSRLTVDSGLSADNSSRLEGGDDHDSRYMSNDNRSRSRGDGSAEAHSLASQRRREAMARQPKSNIGPSSTPSMAQTRTEAIHVHAESRASSASRSASASGRDRCIGSQDREAVEALMRLRQV